MEPKTRLEHFLGKIAGNELAQELEPKTRIEHFLGKIAGNPNAKELEPKTRVEDLLNEIAENDDGGGGSGIPFPEVTVTLNIESPESVAEIIVNLFKRVGNRFKPFIVNEASSQMTITGNLIPTTRAFSDLFDDDEGGPLSGYVFNSDTLYVYGGDYAYSYDFSFSDPVNMTKFGESDEYPNYEIVDPTKPASITVNATTPDEALNPI